MLFTTLIVHLWLNDKSIKQTKYVSDFLTGCRRKYYLVISSLMSMMYFTRERLEGSFVRYWNSFWLKNKLVTKEVNLLFYCVEIDSVRRRCWISRCPFSWLIFFSKFIFYTKLLELKLQSETLIDKYLSNKSLALVIN